jgi:hypothetical protein
MKKLTIITVLFCSLFFSNCDTNDDGFYHNIYLNATHLVSIQTQPNYTVGDYLNVEADFSRYLPDPEHNNALLDIFESTGGATQFAFSYIIERKVSPTLWEVVTINDNQLNITKGNAFTNSEYVYGICIYNALDQSYEYNIGFPLLTAGQYRMSFGYNSTASNTVELRSLSKPKDLILNINSSVANLENGVYYNFTVN